MVSDDVISMPDKWEYPWYAAWDLAFHAIPLALVDPDFAKKQLLLLLQERYLHPNGQVPAYEWNFGDVNPPVHAWAAYFLYQLDRRRTGHADLEFLRSIYNKLLLNFTWWVNRKDPTGRNVFEGGFLGLDNIGVFDRSAPLPTGGHLEQADGTAWMAFYAQTMLQISLELALDDRSYVDMALKFFEHFVWIASAMIHIGGKGEMWDEEDGFFYDVLRTPDGRARQLKVRSMVGLLPLCAATVINEEVMAALPELQQRAGWFVSNRPHLVSNIHDPRRPGYRDRRLLSLLSEERLRRVLARLLDENEFLSPFGIRSLSRHHLEHPYGSTSATTAQGRLPAGRVGQRDVRRQLELARPDLAAGQRPARAGPHQLLRLLRPELHRGVPDRLGAAAPPSTRSRGRSPSGWRASSPPTAAGGGRCSGSRRSSPTTACGAITCCSTSTSTATTAPASAPATRPAGPDSSRR